MSNSMLERQHIQQIHGAFQEKMTFPITFIFYCMRSSQNWIKNTFKEQD